MSEPMSNAENPPPTPAPAPPGRPVGAIRSPGLTIFLTIITLGIWSLVWSFLTAEDVKRYRGQGLGGVITLILAFFVFPVVWFTIAHEVEQLYREDGQEPPVTTI